MLNLLMHRASGFSTTWLHLAAAAVAQCGPAWWGRPSSHYSIPRTGAVHAGLQHQQQHAKNRVWKLKKKALAVCEFFPFSQKSQLPAWTIFKWWQMSTNQFSVHIFSEVWALRDLLYFCIELPGSKKKIEINHKNIFLLNREEGVINFGVIIIKTGITSLMLCTFFGGCDGSIKS
jgi:hypothetical protein